MSWGAAVASDRRQLGSSDRLARHVANQGLVDDDDEAEDDGVAIAPPRGRVDEPRLADHVTDDPVDDLDRVIGRAELDEPRRRSARAGQLQPVAVEPDDEDLGLDRTIDVPTDGRTRHDADGTPGLEQTAAGR